MAAELTVFDPGRTLPEEDRVLARSGCPPFRRGRFGAEAREAIGILSLTAHPRAIARTLDVLEVSGDCVTTGEISLKSCSLARFMTGAVKVSLFLTTIGPAPEMEARRLQEEGFYTRSLFLDSAASCMVEKLARDLHRRLVEEFHDFIPTARFAPGFGDFPLSNQKDIIRLLEGSRAGVSLLEGSCMLMPVKSGTGVTGWIRRRS